MSKQAYDFSRLTEAQQRLLTFGGWSIGSPFVQPQPPTVRKLIERGLVVRRDRHDRGMTVAEYDVPTPVHMAWCELCERRELAAAAIHR